MKMIAEIKVLIDYEDAENTRADLFAACQDLGVSVLESNTRKLTKDEIKDAKNMGIFD